MGELGVVGKLAVPRGQVLEPDEPGVQPVRVRVLGGQAGKVLVENRECTTASADVTRSSVRSG